MQARSHSEILGLWELALMPGPPSGGPAMSCRMLPPAAPRPRVELQLLLCYQPELLRLKPYHLTRVLDLGGHHKPGFPTQRTTTIPLQPYPRTSFLLVSLLPGVTQGKRWHQLGCAEGNHPLSMLWCPPRSA